MCIYIERESLRERYYTRMCKAVTRHTAKLRGNCLAKCIHCTAQVLRVGVTLRTKDYHVTKDDCVCALECGHFRIFANNKVLCCSNGVACHGTMLCATAELVQLHCGSTVDNCICGQGLRCSAMKVLH